MTWKEFCVKKISNFLSWCKDDIKKVSVIEDHFPASKLNMLNGFGFRGPCITWICVNCYLFEQRYKLWTTLVHPECNSAVGGSGMVSPYFFKSPRWALRAPVLHAGWIIIIELARTARMTEIAKTKEEKWQTNKNQ